MLLYLSSGPCWAAISMPLLSSSGLSFYDSDGLCEEIGALFLKHLALPITCSSLYHG